MKKIAVFITAFTGFDEVQARERNFRWHVGHGNIVTLLSANITSWNKNSKAILAEGADILALQETRISKAAKTGARRTATSTATICCAAKAVVTPTEATKTGKLLTPRSIANREEWPFSPKTKRSRAVYKADFKISRRKSSTKTAATTGSESLSKKLVATTVYTSPRYTTSQLIPAGQRRRKKETTKEHSPTWPNSGINLPFFARTQIRPTARF